MLVTKSLLIRLAVLFFLSAKGLGISDLLKSNIMLFLDKFSSLLVLRTRLDTADSSHKFCELSAHVTYAVKSFI